MFIGKRIYANASRALPKNPLLRLLTVNGLIGFFISGLVLSGLLVANVGNIRVLIVQAENPILPLIMLAFGLVITLTSVVMGTAIMALSREDDEGGGIKQHAWRKPMLARVPNSAKTAPGRSA